MTRFEQLPEQMAAHLTIVTQNIFGVPFLNTRARLQAIGEVLNRSPVDVIYLQEVQLSRYVPLLMRTLSSYPFVAYEPFHYAPKGGVMTLSRFALEGVSFVLYEERGWWHTPSLADWMLHKGVLVSHTRVNGTPVVLMNTHLIANYDGDWGKSNRYALQQAAELNQLVRLVRAQSPDALVLIAGDFNFPHHSWLHKEFVAATGTFDALGTERRPTFRSTIPLPKLFSEAIDHVFVRPPANTKMRIGSELLFSEKLRLSTGRQAFVSDHIGIKVRMTWEPERAPTP